MFSENGLRGRFYCFSITFLSLASRSIISQTAYSLQYFVFRLPSRRGYIIQRFAPYHAQQPLSGYLLCSASATMSSSWQGPTSFASQVPTEPHLDTLGIYTAVDAAPSAENGMPTATAEGRHFGAPASDDLSPDDNRGNGVSPESVMQGLQRRLEHLQATPDTEHHACFMPKVRRQARVLMSIHESPSISAAERNIVQNYLVNTPELNMFHLTQLLGVERAYEGMLEVVLFLHEVCAASKQVAMQLGAFRDGTLRLEEEELINLLIFLRLARPRLQDLRDELVGCSTGIREFSL